MHTVKGLKTRVDVLMCICKVKLKYNFCFAFIISKNITENFNLRQTDARTTFDLYT